MVDAAAPRHRVLIVDDEESTRLLLASFLSKEMNVEVQLAGTSEQALHLAQNYAYDAILLDLLMPGMDGYELLARIRGNTPNAATPVIVVSVVDEAASKKRVQELGGDAYYVKPVDRAKLAALVKQHLAARTRGKR